MGDLVHESAGLDRSTVERHSTFLATRLATGAFALAAVPPYLLARGPLCAAEVGAVAGLALGVASAGLLVRTGRLVAAQALASLGLAIAVLCAAGASGDLASPVALWLLAIPADAVPTGSRRAGLVAAAIACLAALALAAAGLAGLHLGGQGPERLAACIFGLVGAAHLAAGLVTATGRPPRRVESAETERALLAVIDDLVTWHDPNGAVLDASPAARRLVGATPASLVGRGLLARVHVSDRPAFLKALSDAGVGRQPVEAEFRLHVGEDEAAPRVIWVALRAQRIASAAKGEAAVVAVIRDVSEHRRHQEALDAARAEAERAEEVRSRFLATVSHELRTPLNAIIGFSEMLSGEMALDAARRREYAGIVHGSGLHLLDVVNALLDMSKIQSGNFDFLPDPLEPARLIAGCCDLMQIKADQAGVTLAREIAQGLPELVADPRACRQILLNLVSNAIKFTPRDGRVTVSARRTFDRIEIAVEDTGIGVAEGDLTRLGEPFFQAGGGYGRRHEGTGLGLSVVRGLAGLHHGEIAIESATSVGTRVTVTLPLDCRGRLAPGGAAPIHTAVRPIPLPLPEPEPEIRPPPVLAAARLFG